MISRWDFRCYATTVTWLRVFNSECPHETARRRELDPSYTPPVLRRKKRVFDILSKRKVEKGMGMGGSPLPFGATDREKYILGLMKSMQRDGRTYQGIADGLNELIKTYVGDEVNPYTTRSGRRWSYDGVKVIMVRLRKAGEIVPWPKGRVGGTFLDEKGKRRCIRGIAA